MKKLILILSFSAFLAENADSQIPVFPSTAVNAAAMIFDINDVNFLNKDTAVAVGKAGLAWQSTDGGLNWNVMPTFTSTVNNNAVYMEDDYICIAGDQGIVTFSNDRGMSWQNAAAAQTTLNYHGVDFADTTFGISVGDAGDAVVYKWSGSFGWVHAPSGLPQKLNAVSAFKLSINPLADGNAIAVGDNGAVATYATGIWTILTNTITANIKSVYLFEDHTTVLAVGDNGLIMRSADYGTTWTILNTGTNEVLNDISEGVTSNQFVAVGDSGVIYVSSDTGYTFTHYSAGFTTSDLKGVSAKNPRGSFGGSGNTLRLFTIDSLSAIPNTTFTSGYSVSPNPAGSLLQVNVPGDPSSKIMKLYNAQCNLVYSQSILKGKNSCDLSSLDGGFYFLVIDGHATKIIIDK